jgi:YbbR domain-containing protein
MGVRMKPSKVSFLIEGPEKSMIDLSADQIEAWVEIPNLSQGQYKVQLDWKLPPDLRIVKRSADQVEVVVPPLE